MTDGKLQAYRTYHRFVRTLVLFGGCLHSPTVTRTFAYCLAGLAIFGSFTQTLSILSICYKYRHNLAIIMKTIGRSTGTTAVVLKVSSFLLNRRYIMEFDRTLHDLFEEELARDKQIRTVLLSNLNEFSIPAYIYPVSVFVAILLYIVPAISNIIRQLIHLKIPAKYGLPFRGLYPWAVPDGLLYHVHFLYEMCNMWFLMFTTCGVDELFGVYAYQISAVLRAMAYRLANPLAGDNFSHLLRTCIEKHKQLLQCRQYLERVYGPIILWPILTNAVIMCALVYEAVPFTDFTLGKFLMLSSYMTLKIMQTFMYTWYGTIITSASDDFRQGIYCSGWPDAVAKRSLRTTMILTMMQESMTVKALKICSVSLEAFSTVMNTTVSYFFLLQTMQKRE